MAAKRLRDEAGDQDSDPSSNNRRMRTVPSVSTVLREGLALRSFQSFAGALEPLIRRVVNEEVERGIVQGARSFQMRSTSIMRQIQAAEESTPLQLVFSKPLSLPIFTASKIEDNENNPLRVVLVDARHGSLPPVSLPSSVRVEIVALDGDFPGERETWTSSEFEKGIVKERTGKRPLLTGDVLLTLRDRRSCAIGDLTFTDNSSWIRSRHFRLGARVAPGSCPGLKVKEAMTERFMVKDHRGELYKKHYPPSLRDEVWRLERIGKEGAFHQKLRAKGINTVQEFLKLWVVDPARLRDILGTGMSDRVWEGTVGHARTCNMGSKLYLHRSPQCTLLLDPICLVQGVLIDGHFHPPQSLHGPQQKFLRQLAREAYEHWEQLEEVDETFAEAASQQQGKALPQIAMQHSPSCSTMYHHTGSQITAAVSTNESSGLDLDAFQVETPMASGWAESPGVAVVLQSSHGYNVSEFSPEGDEDPNPSQGVLGRF